MSNDVPLEKLSTEPTFEVPEYLYLNIPQQYIGVWATLPLNAKISSVALNGINNMSISPSDDPQSLQLKLRNVTERKRYAVAKSPQEFVDRLKKANSVVQKAGEVMQQLIDVATSQGKLDLLTNEQLYKVLLAILKNDGIEEWFIEDLKPHLVGSLLHATKNDYVEVESVLYQGKILTPNEFTAVQKLLLEELNSGSAQINAGEYLYRMPRSHEFEEMKGNNGLWLMPVRTNFVDDKTFNGGASFVDIFEKETDYAGVTIRFPVKLKGFNYRFMSTVAESFMPMFVETEYLDKESGEWKKF